MARFFRAVLSTVHVPVQLNGTTEVLISAETPRTLRQAIGHDEPFAGRFDLPLREHEIYLGRTSPVVEGLASWTLDQALDPESRDAGPVAARCGALFTSAVAGTHDPAGRTLPLSPASRWSRLARPSCAKRSYVGVRRPGGGARLAAT